MSRRFFPLLTALLLPQCAALCADSQFDLELKRLQGEREKALAVAAEPINRRHQTALEALLRRATQAADLNAAIRIRDELQKFGGAAAAPGGAPAAPLEVAKDAAGFEQQLIGTKWVWFEREKLTFLADGKANWNGSSTLWSWKVLKPGQRTIECIDGRNGQKFTMSFDRKLETGRIEDWNARNTRRYPDQW